MRKQKLFFKWSMTILTLFSVFLFVSSPVMAEEKAGGGRIPLAVPAEGRKEYLLDHPFDLIKYKLPDNIIVEEVKIPMRDGINLAATVFRPREGSPVPVITTATPYGKNNYDQWDLFRDPPVGTVPGEGGFYMGKAVVSDHTPFEAPDPGYWVPNGYAVVIVDLPGVGKSESNPEHYPSHHERWIDLMNWMGKQSWSTGKVGMSGVSALTATQWIASMDPAPPELKAIIPWEGMNETGPAGGYGGIPETGFMSWVGKDLRRPNLNPAAKGTEPGPDDWHFDTSRIHVPALICASFSDQELHTWDTFSAFNRIQTKDKWLYNHRQQKWAEYYGEEQLKLQKRFFDRFLKGDKKAMDDVPRVRLEINEDRFKYKVVNVSNWPVPNTQYRSLYLDVNAGKMAEAPAKNEASTQFASSPVGDNQNRVVFDYTFQKDTDLVGYMALKLYIESLDAKDSDLFVGVEKLDTDGNEVYFFSCSGGNANGPVARGWLRASKRELDSSRSTEWKPVLSMKKNQPLKLGEIVEVNIPIMPSGTTFHAGETIRVVVQSWAAPGQWEGGETRSWDVIPGKTKIHTGGKYPARLIIPAVEFDKSEVVEK